MDFDIPKQIQVDVKMQSGKTDNFDQLKELIDDKNFLANKIANELAIRLGINAEVKLHDTSDRYINAISVEGGSVILDTSDFVVGMVEEGVQPYDMKPGLLKSNKVKLMKDGTRYLVVPLPKFKRGRYSWRDQNTGQFTKGSNSGDVEFRIVSDKSDPQSWQHPGYEGNHFVEQTMEESDKIIESIIDDEIEVVLRNL